MSVRAVSGAGRIKRVRAIQASAGSQQPLMAVGMENYVNTQTLNTTGMDSYMMFRPFTIGGGDVSGLRVSFSARTLNAGGSGDTNTAAYTVSNLSINNAALTVQSPPVTFNGGQSTLSVASGDIDKQSDIILPSALGLSSFARGSIVWVKCLLNFATSANIGASGSLQGNWAGTSLTNVQFFSYLSSATTPTNVTTPGKFTWSGTTPSTPSPGFGCMLLGTYVSGTPPVWFGAGDSIMWGFADPGASGAFQRGIFNRAMWDDGTAGRKLSCINATISGLVGTTYNNGTYGLWWARYCNRAIVEVGTNDFTNTGTTAVATVEATRTSIYSTLRAANPSMKILDTLLGPRTSSTVSVSSLSGDGTTVTATTTSAFVASIGGIGATRTCVIAGASPAGYNTVAAGVTMTVASATTVTYANTTTGASSGTITISDIWATETNQTWAAPVSGTGWSPGSNVDQFNTWIKTNGNEAYVDFPQWHGSVSPQNWSGPGNTTDGLHPNGTTINNAMATTTLRPAMDALG